MARLEKDIVVRRSRREVYDFLLDVSTRKDVLPEDFGQFRVTSASPRGVGATLAFEANLGKRLEGEIIVSGVLPPEGVTQIEKIGPVRATSRFALEEAGDDTRVRLVTEYRVRGIVGKILDPVVYGPAMRRWQARVLERLRSAVEGQTEAQAAARAAQAPGARPEH